MANWATVFIHTESKELMNVFKDVDSRIKANEGENGELLIHNNKVFNAEDRYIFDSDIIDDYSFMYSTKWEPNIKDIINVANEIENASFTLLSEEFGVDNNYKVTYRDGKADILCVHIYDYSTPDEENCGVIDNETGEIWVAESDYLDYIINKIENS